MEQFLIQILEKVKLSTCCIICVFVKNIFYLLGQMAGSSGVGGADFPVGGGARVFWGGGERGEK
jgi:hypothetical protein